MLTYHAARAEAASRPSDWMTDAYYTEVRQEPASQTFDMHGDGLANHRAAPPRAGRRGRRGPSPVQRRPWCGTEPSRSPRSPLIARLALACGTEAELAEPALIVHTTSSRLTALRRRRARRRTTRPGRSEGEASSVMARQRSRQCWRRGAVRRRSGSSVVESKVEGRVVARSAGTGPTGISRDAARRRAVRQGNPSKPRERQHGAASTRAGVHQCPDHRAVRAPGRPQRQRR
jgi:hypothetical protein